EAAQGGPGLVEDLGGRDVVDRREVGHHEVPAGQDVPPVDGSPWTLAARARDALWRGFVPLVEARFRVVLAAPVRVPVVRRVERAFAFGPCSPAADDSR